MTHEEFSKSPAKATVRKPAPAFEGVAVVNGQFKNVALSDFKGKWLVMFSYPLDFTFVCPTELVAFSDRIQEFHAIGAEVVAWSCDSEFSHLAWINTARADGGLGKEFKVPLLADKTQKISRDYGVLIEEDGVPLRGLFIVGPEGNVRQITINDLPVGRNVEEVLRLVKAFQFTDKHGEVCPANWTPNSKSMIADPVKSKAYFQAVNK